MSYKSRVPMFIGSGLFVIVLIVVITSIAMAQAGTPQGPTGESVIPNPDAPLAAVPGGPGFVSLSPFAFKNYNAYESYYYSGQMLYSPGGGTFYDAPIALPHGATITKFVVYYIDNNPSGDLYASLLLGDFFSAAATPIAYVASSGAYYTFQSMEVTPASNTVVNNQNNSYIVEVNIPGGEAGLVGVRVDYAYPAMLPLIQK